MRVCKFGRFCLKGRKGNGMLAGVFTVAIGTVLGVSYMGLSITNLAFSKRTVLRAEALSAAEAGVEQGISFIMSGGPNGEAAGEWRTNHPSSNPNDHLHDGWYTESLGDDTSFKLCTISGSGVTDGKIAITSIGQAQSGGTTLTRTVKVVISYSNENVSVWNNVIFGGVGQAGKSVNGNVAIKGSVHLLGDGENFTDSDLDLVWDDKDESYTDSNHNGKHDLTEPFVDTDGNGVWSAREDFIDNNGNGTRDPALTVTDMASEVSGNANIGNNYSGMSALLRSKVSDPAIGSFHGEAVETLQSKLRVKHGRVSISGSATVGDVDQTGNGIKETLEGAYVSDGFGGTAGTGSVNSDNGYQNGYDLGDGVVDMPSVVYKPYTSDSGTDSGVTYINYMAYLKQHATFVSGDLTINKGTAYSVTGPNGSLNIDAAGNMTITGIVYVQGNISIGPKNTTITYSGKGTLACTGTAYMHNNILPAGKFATNDALGIIAADKAELATGSGDAQLTMALAVYAEHRIISSKQNQIAGTFVSNYYEMTNVPSIFQVPDLATNLPPGMPGGHPIYLSSVKTDSWMEK